MRDVKQHNFLLNNGIYQLCDFGISKLLNTTNANAATQCGTPMFFAPEMAARVKYSNKVDIFSAGVMLYYMYQGSYPFKGSTVDQILNNIRNAPDNTTPKACADNKMKDLISLMLSKNPDKRPSARQLLITGVFDDELKKVLKLYKIRIQ